MKSKNSSFLETSSSNIYYEILGDSSDLPVIVLHGGPGFSHNYLRLKTKVWDELSLKRPIIFYDQRGTGKSLIKKSGSCKLIDQINDLHQLREKLGFEKIIILGHSWGGYLGMAYNAYYPNFVHNLILIDSAAPCFNDTIFLQKFVFPEIQEKRNDLSFRVELGQKRAIEEDIINKFSMLFYSKDIRTKILSVATEISYNYDVHKELRADIDKFDLTSELIKFKNKTLIITGRFDMNVAPLVAYKIHKLIPNSEYEVFEYSGHLPFIEEQEKFIEIINSFLE